jgi:DNA-binding beta-propeller fold protein YncE
MHLRTLFFTREVVCAILLLTLPARAVQAEESTIAATKACCVLDGEDLPTGMKITPTATPGATFQQLNPDLPPPLDTFVVGHAVATAVSPDGKTLLILTSGYNRNELSPGGSNEYVFVFDISTGTPVKRQVLQLPYTFHGIAWRPQGDEFYVSGGASDNVHVFQQQNDVWAEAMSPIVLGHTDAPGWGVSPVAAGVAVNARGDRLVVANIYNDSISIVDLPNRAKLNEVDLRPGKIDSTQSGLPGGQYPFGIVIQGNEIAYVSSQRDREVVVVNLAASTPAVLGRIAVSGQPNKLLLNKDGSLLFATLDNSDTVVMIDTKSRQIIEELETIAPDSVFPNRTKLKGSNPNSLALSPDEQTLYVTNGGLNAVSVIQLAPLRGGKPTKKSKVIGLIPTGWYPNSVSLNGQGTMLYVVNGKSKAGPNPALYAGDQYVLQLLKAGFLAAPIPDQKELVKLTQQVAVNNRFPGYVDHAPSRHIMEFLRNQIAHVIYVVKENRTYDQVLGDLEKGNGDPSLALFGEALSPNHHRLARQYVTLDNFLHSGSVSADGWNWTVAARATDFTEKTVPVNYAGRGFSYDWQGQNRNINTAHGTVAERQAANPFIPSDPDILPGTADIAAPDSPSGDEGEGYLWDAALRAGRSLRHYGQFTDWNLYYAPPPAFIPLSRSPFAEGIVQAYATKAELQKHTDVYYRGFDMKLPDYWLFKEWEREFDDFVKNNNLPHLSMIALPHDHFGDFGGAIDGVNTPDTQMADNDYALGLLVEKVANSPYKNNTLIVITEDDPQDGPDHVDAHRTLAYIVGPYVKQGPVISTRYTTVNLLRTIEEILRLQPLGIYDGLADPMWDVFDRTQKEWTYTAVVPEVLRTTALPLPAPTAAASLALTEEQRAQAKPRHEAAYWVEKTTGLNFHDRDAVDSSRFNRILWTGLKGEAMPYPARTLTER